MFTQMYIYSMANQKSNQPTMTVELSLVDFCHIKNLSTDYLPLHCIVLCSLQSIEPVCLFSMIIFYFLMKKNSYFVQKHSKV